MAYRVWYPDLSGSINQHTSPQLLANNQAEILVNVSQSELGTWSHRLGTTRVGDLISASNPMRGLQMFMKSDGTFWLHSIHDGNLYVLDEGTDTWDLQENAAGTGLSATSEVDFTNFIERHYFIGNQTGEYLKYCTETGASTYQTVATSTVSASSSGTTLITSAGIFNDQMIGFTVFNTTDGTDTTITAYTSSTQVTVADSIGDTWDGDTVVIRMDGKYLASNGAYMMIAGSEVYPLRSYWSSLSGNTDNNRPFFDTKADFAATTTPHTGIAAFGNNRPFIIFTENTYMVVDPARRTSDEVEGFGCSSHRSIANLKGSLIWFGRGGFQMLAYNQAFPTEISLPIRNDATGDAIINKINSDNYSVLAAGIIEDRYYCALRNLTGTVKGQTLNDCVVEFDYSQQNWRVHTFTSGGLGSVFAQFINEDGERKLYGGSVDNGAVYKMEALNTFTDDDSAGDPQPVTSVMRSKHYQLGSAEAPVMSNVDKLYIKYASEETLDVDYCLDGEPTFTDLPDLAAASTNAWNFAFYNLGKECRTFGVELTTTDEFTIFSLGLQVESTGNEGTPSN